MIKFIACWVIMALFIASLAITVTGFIIQPSLKTLGFFLLSVFGGYVFSLLADKAEQKELEKRFY